MPGRGGRHPAGADALDTATLQTRPDEADGGGGVYAVVGNPDGCSRARMVEKGLYANSRGTAMLFYRPYHLCGAETAMSILCAGLLGVPTGSATILPRADMAARVTSDLGARTVLGDPEARDAASSAYRAAPMSTTAPLAPVLERGFRMPSTTMRAGARAAPSLPPGKG